jgi:catechol 2,3-dioxygenase-like lactoylglutathione lyase family enzyme
MSGSDRALAGGVLGIQHVNIPSADLSRSEEFYCTILGLPRLTRPSFPVRGIWLGVNSTQSIHITESEDVPVSAVSHFAIQVHDLDNVLEMMKVSGVAFTLGDPVEGAGRQAYVSDPDGNVVEIIQLPGSER